MTRNSIVRATNYVAVATGEKHAISRRDDGSSYIRLVDLTDKLGINKAKYIYSGVEDRENNQVTINSIDKFTFGDDKTIIGFPAVNETAKAVYPVVYIDDTEVINMSIYNVNGEYYYKLSEIADEMGYDVGYDTTKKAITLKTRADKY